MIRDLTKLYIGKRVLATIIDYTLIFAFQIVYTLEFGERNENGGYTISGWSAMVPILFWFIYIVITERYAGGTMGHLICKVKVESLTKERITLWRTFIRRIVDCLEIAWCFGLIAFLLARNTQNNQRLGDILAKTCVIGKDDKYQEIQFDFEMNE
jgi:uncharacterized RDD family membrane protein YckC